TGAASGAGAAGVRGAAGLADGGAAAGARGAGGTGAGGTTGMMAGGGGGAGSGASTRDRRKGLGGPLAPRLEDEDDVAPRPLSAGPGER
ncbi:hypothetical protein ACFUMH_10285, partial [Cellulomonas sp. NPDC057328]|uniref:hypothetical protein n=1 Tax=Cellulomonas sp. NPDC057328 TaxID=3346101 RepID=UPI00362F07D0